jgi:hypothetical protein
MTLRPEIADALVPVNERKSKVDWEGSAAACKRLVRRVREEVPGIYLGFQMKDANYESYGHLVIPLDRKVRSSLFRIKTEKVVGNILRRGARASFVHVLLCRFDRIACLAWERPPCREVNYDSETQHPDEEDLRRMVASLLIQEGWLLLTAEEAMTPTDRQDPWGIRCSVLNLLFPGTQMGLLVS